MIANGSRSSYKLQIPKFKYSKHHELLSNESESFNLEVDRK